MAKAKNLFEKWRLYRRDKNGNMATMFALSAFVVLVATGASIDYAMMTSQHSKIQNYADTAALAAAASGEETERGMAKAAKAALDANNTEKRDIDLHLDLKDEVIRVKVGYKYKPTMMTFLGKGDIAVNAIAEVPLPGKGTAHVALVLDRTGSMQAAGNLPPLKRAAGKLIDRLKDNDGDVKVAVVPFSDYVNVGVRNRNKPWADVPPDTSVRRKHCYWHRPVKRRYNCVWKWRTHTVDGVRKRYRYRSCKYEYGPREYKCRYYTSRQKFYGCMGSRNAPYNQRANFDGKKIKGMMNRWCGQELLPLTSNLNTVKRKINSLTGSGNTYMPAGLLWGWRTLEKNAPFEEAKKGDDPSIRAMVFMTDGKNTLVQSGYYHTYPNRWRPITSTDLHTAALCENIKRSGIVVYTVAYNFPGAEASGKRILKKCASDLTKYYDAKNANQLEEAFKDIGNDLSQVRLSH